MSQTRRPPEPEVDEAESSYEPDPEDFDPVYEAWLELRKADGEGLGIRASGPV